MQDRISNHPNRWVLTPVTGETNTYDFTRADDPTQTGTPLNKATFLPDATVSALESATGVSGISLPADALNAIATYLSSIGTTGNLTRIAFGSYTGAGGTSTTKTVTLNFSFKPRFLVITKSGGANDWVGRPVDGESAMWQYNIGYMRGSVVVTYSGGTSISWKCTSTTQDDRPVNRMDVSGTTYYYFCVGVD